tara:strand:- start:668 stop:859 length:192 start_codon:yes stop_codon:yes gene_type:complete
MNKNLLGLIMFGMNLFPDSIDMFLKKAIDSTGSGNKTITIPIIDVIAKALAYTIRLFKENKLR